MTYFTLALGFQFFLIVLAVFGFYMLFFKTTLIKDAFGAEIKATKKFFRKIGARVRGFFAPAKEVANA